MLKITIFLLFFGCVSTLYADTLYLKNKRSMEGIVKSEDSEMVDLEVYGGSVKFKKSEIDRIEKTTAAESGLLRRKWEAKKKEQQQRIEQQKLAEEEKPKRIEFSKDSQGIIIEATLNNKVKVSLVLDTGASVILLGKGVAEKLGINPGNMKPDAKITVADGRKVDAKYITLESVKVVNVEAVKVEAAIIFDEIGDAGFHDGLLGMSFLKRFNFKVDQRDKKLILERLE
jgi:clan AA aspartic protease (TIGR02281 family)